MKEPPAWFPTPRLVEALEDNWALGIDHLQYLPVGFGAHHWRATSAERGELFVSLHDLDLMGRFSGDRGANFQLLSRAMATARWLESVAGLEFVLGPLPDRSGNVVRVVAERFAVHLYPWIDCAPLEDADGTSTATLVARLHGVTDRLPAPLASVEDFEIPHRRALETALADLAIPWTTGPYAEPARAQLRQHEREVRALIAFYDRSAERAGAARRDWVLTHGEPRGPNLIRTANGRVRLIDWDTVLLAPRERDLWEVPRTGAALPAYQAVADVAIDGYKLRLYEAWYALAEVSVYLAVFRSAHVADGNVVLSWQNYLDYLPTVARWPELVSLR